MKTDLWHFWVGSFASENDFFDFMGEDPNFYLVERDLKEKYISRFAQSQGENFVDHDLMECGFQDGDKPIAERFKSYSFSKEWLPEIERRIEKNKIRKVNSIIFAMKGVIKNPIDVIQEKVSLTYVGTIEI